MIKHAAVNSSTRKAVVKGLFYPEECVKVKAYIAKFNQKFNTLNFSKSVQNIVPRAVIVPHAGYIYSGFTANFAYRFLRQAKAKRFIIIGPSHHHYFQGISGSYYENYETPCGDIKIDSPYLFALAKQFNIGFEPKAHQKEHSTEVQMPFIKEYFPQSKVIELIYSDTTIKTLALLIIALLQNQDNAVVISSDLSHFHSQEDAKAFDENCLRGVVHLNLAELEQGCKACGLMGIQAILLAAKHFKLSSKLLDYRTSADTSKDIRSVVGYMSAVFY